jgi:hypothetical protein
VTTLLLETEIPAEVLAEVLDTPFCQGGEMVQVGEDDWTADHCSAPPVPGYDYCPSCGGVPGLETFEGSPFGQGAPQAWWLP